MRHLQGLTALMAIAAAALAIASPAAGAQPRVLAVEFDNDVNPVTRDYLTDSIRRGEREGFAAVVIEMDTPGGLGSSMRDIVKEMLAADVPVIVYVSPPGSSADSAGAVIGQAADVLAMAPQTNIGSSTPINASGEDFSEDLRRKVVNDAAAYISELAREHGRNPVAAAQMVRKASNFGAREALARNVVDVIAPTLPALLREVDGRTVQPKGITLETAGAEITDVSMSWWKRALDLLIDPTVIQLMLSLGLVGILVELWNPGLIFPGTVGAISLVIGLYGLQVLPVSVAGVLLLLVAFGFFAAEAFVPSHGALTLGGAVLFVVGSLLLFDPAGPAYEVSLWTTVAIAATLSLLLGIALTRIARVRRLPRQVTSGRIVGHEGEVRRGGYVLVDGELWRARSADERPLSPGERVIIESVADDFEVVVNREIPAERT